jgi:predicted NodU family carbamoyl transferase
MSLAKSLTGTDSLVYMGGCAMNSKANLKVTKEWRRVWSLPNPGDFSSSIGAVLYHTKQKLKWQGTLAKHIQISV